MHRRFALALLSAFAWPAHAQSDAAAPLVIVTGAPAGTPGDVLARALSGALSAELGAPVVVENRPGAIGTLALSAVARAKPDGRFMGILGLPAAVAPGMLASMPYDTLGDLATVRQLSAAANVLVVSASGPFASVAQVVAAARMAPLTYASGGNGTPAHLAGELFAQQAKLPLRHVPFNGAVAGVTAVAGGHVDMMFATSPSVVGLVKGGKLRALATTGAQRMAAWMEVPTMAELGYADVVVQDWHGVVVPASTPAAVVDRLSAALGRALGNDAVRKRLAALGLDPVSSDPTAFRSFLRAEMTRWETVVRTARITVQ